MEGGTVVYPDLCSPGCLFSLFPETQRLRGRRKRAEVHHRAPILRFRLTVHWQCICSGSRKRSYSVDLLRLVIAILLPPLGVFLQVGIGKHFWINILLTLLGYIPGIIHAVWVIVKY